MQNSTYSGGSIPAPRAMVHSIDDWAGLLSQSMMAFSVECDRTEAFHGYLRTRKAAQVDFIEMSTGPHISSRRMEDIDRNARPEYLLCLQLAGVGEFSQDNRTAVLQPGDLTLFDTTRPTTVVSSTNYRNLCMKFPQQIVGLPRDQVGELTAMRIGARKGLAPAAGTLLLTLNQTMDNVSGRSRALAAQGAVDLVAAMFRNELDVAAPLHRDKTWSHLEQAQIYIDGHLSEPDLSPAMVAGALYISVRQLHSIFHDEGFTVSSWIRDRRLQRCQRDLSDPALRSRSAASIGARWGFKTASHFGRAFKDVFGQTPADFRHETLGPLAVP